MQIQWVHSLLYSKTLTGGSSRGQGGSGSPTEPRNGDAGTPPKELCDPKLFGEKAQVQLMVRNSLPHKHAKPEGWAEPEALRGVSLTVSLESLGWIGPGLRGRVRGSHQSEVSHLPRLCWQTRAAFCGEGRGGGNLLFCQVSREWEAPRLWRSPLYLQRKSESLRGGSPKPRKGDGLSLGSSGGRCLPAYWLERKSPHTIIWGP